MTVAKLKTEQLPLLRKGVTKLVFRLPKFRLNEFLQFLPISEVDPILRNQPWAQQIGASQESLKISNCFETIFSFCVRLASAYEMLLEAEPMALLDRIENTAENREFSSN